MPDPLFAQLHFHSIEDASVASLRTHLEFGTKVRMLEIIVEAVGRFALWLFGTLGIVTAVFYPVGWLMLKIVTFGRYPPPSVSQRTKEIIALLPFVFGLVWITVALS